MPSMFPTNPSVGQKATIGNRTYQWSGAVWKASVPDTISAPSLTSNNITANTSISSPTITSNNITANTSISAPTVTSNNITANTSISAPTVTSNNITANTINSDNVNYANGEPRSAGGISSIDVLGGNTGLTTSGGPITTSGNIILSGVLNIENGGTGANTAAKAITSLLPNQTNNAGKFLKTTGTGLQWETISGGTSSNTSNSEPSDATYSYDDQSRIISVTETIDGSQKVSSYSYNSNNTVSTATIVFQGVTRIETYGYDSNGLVTSMTATYP